VSVTVARRPATSPFVLIFRWKIAENVCWLDGIEFIEYATSQPQAFDVLLQQMGFAATRARSPSYISAASPSSWSSAIYEHRPLRHGHDHARGLRRDTVPPACNQTPMASAATRCPSGVQCPSIR
jgi:hypothetical protein